MKMLRIAAGLALAACFALFAGCSLPSLQQQFATYCGIVNTDLETLGSAPQLTADQQATIMQKVLPANEKICAAGVKVNVSDLKSFHDSLLPVVIAIVQATPALPNQTLILLGLQTFGPLVQMQVDQLITVVAPPASAPPAAAPLQ